MPPGTIAHSPVQSTDSGHGSVTGRPPLYRKHGVQVAQRRPITVAGEQLTVQGMHLGTTPLKLTTDRTVGYIDIYEGPTYEVSPNELKWLAKIETLLRSGATPRRDSACASLSGCEMPLPSFKAL